MERSEAKGSQEVMNKSADQTVNEIIDWLEGLENTLRRVIREESDPATKAQFEARRGVYEGVADDIRNKWGSRK